MKLSNMLKRTEHTVLSGSVDIEISDIIYDSRKVIEDCLFVCISGTVTDGHIYIEDAVKKGAKALIVTKDIEPIAGVTIIKVLDDRAALAEVSAAFFDYPAEKLKTVGITGTKGKTSTTYMVYNVLTLSGKKCGLIGTIETIIGDTHIPSSHSTPESYVIQKTFADMVKAGIEVVVMEVSSQGLKMKRVHGITFDYGVFTNLEPDHIGGNEHPDFADYLYCKSLLFKTCKVAVANADDSHFEEIMKDRTCELVTLGTKPGVDYCAASIELKNPGIKFHTTGICCTDVTLSVPGRFNVYNALTALAICELLGIELPIIIDGLKKVKVRGRVETVDVSDKFTIMVDYAHNEMSLRSVLSTLKEYNPKRLVCLFGCGGNRSKDRRYTMGRVSGELADFTIVTSDNPRFEEPKDIIADIVSSIEKVPGANFITIEDRYEAIKYAVACAEEGDMILVAGKGHEDYQEIKGVKYHMDDVEMILKAAKECEEEK